MEVRQLLDKIQPDAIVLDPTAIGKVRREPKEVREERARLQQEANMAKLQQEREKADSKTKVMGKNRPTRVHRRKQDNRVLDKKELIKERRKEEEERKMQALQRKEAFEGVDVRVQTGTGEAPKPSNIPAGTPRALERLFKRDRGV